MSSSGIVNFRGNDYYTVARRVHDFRQAHPISQGWGIATEILPTPSDQVVRVRAVITDPDGRVVATGVAEEVRSTRGVNSTSALENCETSALGRCLAAAGFGGSGQYASADELALALAQQEERSKGQGRKDSSRTGPRTHPSWNRYGSEFTSQLGIRGLTVAEVSEYTLGKGWGQPRIWSEAARLRFLEQLDAGAFADGLSPDLAAADAEPAR